MDESATDPSDTALTLETVIASANLWGARYREALASDDRERATAKIVGSATVFLCELAQMIPARDENNDAHILMGALIAAITESAHGKRTHPLLQSIREDERVAGVEQKGLNDEYLAGIAAGAVVFLEMQGWRTDPACKFVSRGLEHWGARRCGLSTVKKWCNEVSLLSEPRSESRRFIGIMTMPTAKRAAREFEESGRTDPAAFIRQWLGEQMKAISSLLGI